jgi:hypothetical protein
MSYQSAERDKCDTEYSITPSGFKEHYFYESLASINGITTADQVK